MPRRPPQLLYQRKIAVGWLQARLNFLLDYYLANNGTEEQTLGRELWSSSILREISEPKIILCWDDVARCSCLTFFVKPYIFPYLLFGWRTVCYTIVLVVLCCCFIVMHWLVSPVILSIYVHFFLQLHDGTWGTGNQSLTWPSNQTESKFVTDHSFMVCGMADHGT